MKITKGNKIVSLNNIIVGFMFCINVLVIANCTKVKYYYYIFFTDSQYSIINTSLKLMFIAIAISFIINLVYIFKNWHNKKSMVINILTIISIIATFVLKFVFDSYICWYMISLVAIFGILLLMFNKNEEEGKKHRLLVALIVINIILFIASIVLTLSIKNDFEVKHANNEKNLLKNIIQLSNSTTSKAPIRVKKNDKWGYIDTNGNTIVDFICNDCFDFIGIDVKGHNKKYYIAPISVGNELKIITNNNKEIVSFKNKKMENLIDCNFFSLSINLEDDLKYYAEKLNKEIKFPYKHSSLDRYEKEEKYNVNGSYDEDVLSFNIENNKSDNTSKLLYNTETQSITYNRRKISIDGYLYIYKEDYFKYLPSYKNGFIPIYNFEEENFGWIDLNGKTHYINGKVQILDFTDNYIAVKDYSIDDDSKICIMDYDGNVVSDYYKEIKVLPKGFVVKKQNGKNVCLDENLSEITEEYDIIDTYQIDDGILIVSNLNKTTSDLYDFKFDLININNFETIATNLEDVGSISDDIYYASKFDDLTDSEFEEILCSVDCDYINTELYEKNYK